MASTNSTRYSTVRPVGSRMGSSSISMGSGRTNRQHTVSRAMDTTKGGAMIPMNSPVGMLKKV